MENYIIERLSELARLLKIMNEKLELIQKSVILSIRINGKMHGFEFKTSSGEIDDSILDEE
jgi:hypothetical protein